MQGVGKMYDRNYTIWNMYNVINGNYYICREIQQYNSSCIIFEIIETFVYKIQLCVDGVALYPSSENIDIVSDILDIIQIIDKRCSEY